MDRQREIQSHVDIMATFFGEVKYLVSRAYDEADDDEDAPDIT